MPRRRSAASSTSRSAFPARRSSRRRCAIFAFGSRSSASICGSAQRVDAQQLRDFHHVVVATGIVPAGACDSGYRPSEGRELRRHRDGRAGGRVACGGDRRWRNRFRRGRVPHRRTTRPTDTSSDGRIDDPAIAAFRSEWGIDAQLSRTRRREAGRGRWRRRAKSGCSSARRPRSAKDWRRPRAGSGERCSRNVA